MGAAGTSSFCVAEPRASSPRRGRRADTGVRNQPVRASATGRLRLVSGLKVTAQSGAAARESAKFGRSETKMPRVEVDGRGLFYESQGEGTPLVFLSGLGGDHRAFAVPMKALATSYRVLALDNRDVGQSDRAEGDYGTAEMADDAAGWLRSLGVE